MPTNTSGTERNEWIDVPDTKGLSIALRVALIAIYLIAAGFFVYGSLTAPTDPHPIARVLTA
jgi:hypothetical protein